MKPLPTPVLADLLVHASSAARVVGRLGGRAGSATLEDLSGHVDALVHGLSELVSEHRLAADDAETDVVDELRQFMARADALASATSELFSRIGVLTDGDRRDFTRLAHLVEMTAMAVAGASEASSKLIAIVERHLPQEHT
ncbi:MAG TPA: hypothetical protein VNO30_02270 [Kofleriaceae bacterium]|nr:hypothetical protein [Kofleriaceae bacterium]